MTVSERVAARTVAGRRQDAQDEVHALLEAGLAVLRRRGANGLTVADVLAEAGLSTRAFYRHFRSKDALVLAVYEHEAEGRHRDLVRRLGAAPSPRAALEAWIDALLALAFDPRRARRTRVLLAEGVRLQADHPVELAAILAGAVAPLVDVLRAYPDADPEADAWSIHAVTWEVVQQKLRGAPLDFATARAHVLRFCTPAIGEPA